MRNSKKLYELDKLLRPLQEAYARKAWKIASRFYDIENAEQRRLAFATVCGVDYSCALMLARLPLNPKEGVR